MLYKRNLKNIFVLFVVLTVFTLPFTHCKKNSTTPDMNLLTRPVIWQDFFSMSFIAYETGANPSSQVLHIKNSGQQTLDYTLSTEADWVSISPVSGTSSGQETSHTISVDKKGLTPQNENYTATITITSSQAYNNPQAVTVNLKISKEPPPEIWTNTKQLTFNAQEEGSNPSPQTIIIKNTGTASLDYEITKDVNWLNVNPKTGTVQTGEKSHPVSVNTGGLKNGTYNGTITISDPNATNNPQKIKVILNLSEKPLPGPPPPPSPPPSPPSTDNEVGISIVPKEGVTGTVVTLTIFIDGNLSPISTFGLELNYDPSILQYQSTSKGTLSGSWPWLDGNANSGKITVGGLRGTAPSIPTGSQGSLAIVKLKVIHTGSSDLSTQITLNNLSDDLSGMIIKPVSVTFTYKN